MKMSARGKVEFTEDESDVQSLTPGGSFVVERSVGGIGGFFASDVKRFEARESNGRIERKYLVDGRELGADEGRKWLASFLPQTLRNMAVNADRRVARQLAKGGPSLVLAEITKTDGTFARSVYLRELYKQAQLDPQTLAASFAQAGRELTSDFELGQALKTAAEHQAIDTAMPAFVQATRAIESDFELRQVLSKAIARPGLTAENTGAIFKAAVPAAGGAGISSAFELAELLKKAARDGHVSDANVAAYLSAARQVESDFERRGVMQALASGQPVGPAHGRGRRSRVNHRQRLREVGGHRETEPHHANRLGDAEGPGGRGDGNRQRLRARQGADGALARRGAGRQNRRQTSSTTSADASSAVSCET